MNTEQVTQFAHDLRKLAAFLENNADAAAESGAYFRCEPTCYIYGDAEALLTARRTFKGGGVWHKVIDDHSFTFAKQFGERVTFSVYTSREAVCERVQVGTKTETVKDYDAVEIPTKEVETPVYEYHCPPVLGGSNPDYIGE